MVAALDAVEPGTSFFLYNSPHVAILLPSRDYHQFLMLSSTVTLGTEQLPHLAQGTADLVIVGTNDHREHEELFDQYPVSKRINQFLFLTKE
jgi:hypothetical protein